MRGYQREPTRLFTPRQRGTNLWTGHVSAHVREALAAPRVSFEVCWPAYSERRLVVRPGGVRLVGIGPNILANTSYINLYQPLAMVLVPGNALEL